MKLKRILRDLLFLAMFCGTFYLLVAGTQSMGVTTSDNSSEFSVDRQEADKLLLKKKYEEAIEPLERLVSKDQYNSYAILWLGHSTMQISAQQKELLARDNLSEAEREAASEKFETYNAKSIETFERLLDFPRLVNRARYCLAILNLNVDETDKTLSYLSDALENGFYTRRGLANYSSFGPIKENPEFIKLCNREKQNYRRYVRSRNRPTIAN